MREGCRLPPHGEQMLWCGGEEKGESLTSVGMRKGGGVSEWTLMRPLGHTR